MKPTKRSNLGAIVILATLVALLGLAIVFLYVGWYPADDETGEAMSTTGYVAMAFGIVATLALGIGLMGLLFYSSRKGHDRTTDRDREE